MDCCDCAADSGDCLGFECCDACCPGGRSTGEKRRIKAALREARFRRNARVWFIDGGQLFEGKVRKVSVGESLEVFYIFVTMDGSQRQIAEARLYPTRDEAVHALLDRKRE